MAQPTGRKLGALVQRMQDAQRGGGAAAADLVTEAAPLQRKLARALTIMSWLPLLSAATMAIARYV